MMLIVATFVPLYLLLLAKNLSESLPSTGVV